MNPHDAIAEALVQSQAVPPPTDPLALNQALAAQAAPNQNAVHPLVEAIMNRLGLLNFLRNRSNQNVVDPEAMSQ